MIFVVISDTIIIFIAVFVSVMDETELVVEAVESTLLATDIAIIGVDEVHIKNMQRKIL